MNCADIPDLEPGCGSWIVTDLRTGKAVVELYSKRLASAVNQQRYRVEAAMQYLTRINANREAIYDHR